MSGRVRLVIGLITIICNIVTSDMVMDSPTKLKDLQLFMLLRTFFDHCHHLEPNRYLLSAVMDILDIAVFRTSGYNGTYLADFILG